VHFKMERIKHGFGSLEASIERFNESEWRGHKSVTLYCRPFARGQQSDRCGNEH
jgi:hypothetical protein